MSWSDLPPDDVDMTRPSWARVDNYLLRGKDNFEPDRQLAEAMLAAAPGLRELAQQNRRFLLDAVEVLAAEDGVRQYLDIGSAYPAITDNVHDVAQRVYPSARIIYVDHDPIVAAHARALLVSSAAGRVEFIHVDARKPHSILDDPAFVETIDVDEPVGLILTAVLMCFTDDEAHEIVATLVDGMPAGSHVVISHPAAESESEALQAAAVAAEKDGLLFVPRTREQVAAFVTGLDLATPGLVPMRSWRRGVQTDKLPRKPFSWAVVARKR